MPKLMSHQKEVWEYFNLETGNSKVAVVKSERQKGKSSLAQLLLIGYGMHYQNGVSVMVSVTLQQARAQFEAICKSAYKLIKNANNTLLTIEFKHTNSKILFKSAAQGQESIRGYTVKRGILIFDECAFLPDTFIYACLPLTQYFKNPILYISTPWDMSGHYWNMWDEANKNPSDTLRAFDWSLSKDTTMTEEQKAMYKKTLSKAAYTTEVLGCFLSLGDALLFTNMNNCIENEPDRTEKQNIFVGIDFGTGVEDGDYTAISILNNSLEQIHCELIHNMEPKLQVEYISRLLNDYSSKYIIKNILAEVNSIGAIYLSYLKDKVQVPISEWVTNNATKQEIVTELQMAFSQQTISILGQPEEQLIQLRAYQAELTPSRKITYNAVEGFHDDAVIALALSLKAHKSAFGSYKITSVQNKYLLSNTTKYKHL